MKMKNILVPAILFIVSAFLSISFKSFIYISLVLGLVLYIKSRMNKKQNDGAESTLLARSGISLIVAPIITVAFVFAGMKGLFSIFSGN